MGHAAHAQPAPAQVSAALTQKSAEAAGIAARADSQGSAPIIVEFATGLSGFSRDSAFIAALKGQVAAAQSDIVATHFGSVATPRPGQGFDRSLQLFDITPMFAVRVNRTELEALAADTRVVRIHENKLSAPVLSDSVPLIGMTGTSGAYALGATGAGQAVAVLDTGVQSNHEFVSGKVVSEACFSNGGGGSGRVSLCPNGTNSQSGTGAADAQTTQCINGSTELCQHGTHVAGIAAGYNTSQGSGEPPYGVAKDAKVVAVQVFTRFNNSVDCSPSSAPCVLSWDSDQIAALNWVLQNAINLSDGSKLASINMSLGGGYYTSTCDSDSRKSSIDSLLSAGVATVIASGNSYYTDGVGAPGCISSAVTVAASDKTDVIASYSNMGPQVDLFAPGSSIQSSIPVVPSSTTTYAYWNGTSMATPHVAGAFAAIRDACPTKTVAQILSALQSTGLAISDTRSGGTYSKNRIRVGQAVQQLACSTGQKVTQDFNGDSKSDVLWRNSSGFVAEWLLNGSTISSNVGVGTVDTSWSIAGTGDFNGDGKTDILWRSPGGFIAMWLMNGNTITSNVGVGTVGSTWQVIGIGDFNGDGYADILWRNNSTGFVAMWLLNGNTITANVGVSIVDTSWSVAGIGDFNGDGKSDVLWRNTSGFVALWLMNSNTISSNLAVGTVDSTWQIVGVGDFNGDGKTDVLWKSPGGFIAMWLMNSNTITSNVGVGTVTSGWEVAKTGDFNGDGKADILWRSSGNFIATWLMNGNTITSNAGVGSVTTGWTIQATNPY